MPKKPARPAIPPISGVHKASELFDRPRGPSYGPRKLKPAGRPQRTASVELSKLLGNLDEMLHEQTTFMPARVQAELRAIAERNLSGTWTQADIERVKALSKPKPQVLKPSKEVTGSTKQFRPSVREIPREQPADRLSKAAVSLRSSRIIMELDNEVREGLEITPDHQAQLTRIGAKIRQGLVKIGDLELLEKIRRQYIRRNR